MKFKIWYGLSGGFGGCKGNMDPEIEEFETEEEAEKYAYEMSMQEYEMYEGLHGLRTVQDIIEEGEAETEEEAEEIYLEERDTWLDYVVEKVDG